MSDFQLDFNDTKTAFGDKSNTELRQKYKLFKMLNSTFLNNFGTRATELALGLGLPVSWLIKRTVFEQFCGGENIKECQPTIDKLAASGIGTILDYSIEGKALESEFDLVRDEIMRNLKRAKDDDDIPFAVFKTTGIAPLGTLEKVSSNADLMKDSNKIKWKNAQRRVHEICEYAASIDQSVFIDAEESWIQPAIDSLVTQMMEEFNKSRAIVFNTLQMYRTDRLEYLKASHEEAKKAGYFYAVKLVRGAYMEKERERAEEMGYESPIQPDKASTDKDFDAATEYCLDNLDTISFVAATHNETSVQRLAKLMDERNVPNNREGVYFSQLYGMSDNLSYILAAKGYNVTKYVPYGPVEDAIPYLIRRARENTSVMGHMSRELELIKKELVRRGI
ncbi:MAG: proline dehydrogenase family protein [Pyrinomonadaceae bacterium]